MKQKKCKHCGNHLPKNDKDETCGYCDSINKNTIQAIWYNAGVQWRGRIEKIAKSKNILKYLKH